MGLSFEQIEAVKKQFIKEYLFNARYGEYIIMCGISKLGLQDGVYRDSSSKDDLCLSVGLLKPLPDSLVLPKEYLGVRVCVKVIGEITAL